MNLAPARNHLLLQRRQQRTAQRKIKAAAGCRVLDTEQFPVSIAPFAHAHLNGVGDHAIENTQRFKYAQAVLPNIDGSSEDADLAALLVDPNVPAFFQKSETGGQSANSSPGNRDSASSHPIIHSFSPANGVVHPSP